jgi:FkbM family methyltransferase
MLSTNQKVSIARALSWGVVSARGLVGAPSTTVATRGGVTWKLDLKEGVDLSIYLLGGFEPRTLRRYKDYVSEGDVVFDIGANVGAHALPLAQLVGATGKVIAFEPTKYAFQKLLANVDLNPQLKSRIVPNQLMLVRSTADVLPDAIYSSWPLEQAEDLHSDHRGRLKATDGARATTLDDYARQSGVHRLDFVKLDVDGHEHEVLQGAAETLKRFRPRMMLELAPYVYKANPAEFDAMLDLLWSSGYNLEDIGTGADLPRDPTQIRNLIPSYGAMNVLASIK